MVSSVRGAVLPSLKYCTSFAMSAKRAATAALGCGDQRRLRADSAGYLGMAQQRLPAKGCPDELLRGG